LDCWTEPDELDAPGVLAAIKILVLQKRYAYSGKVLMFILKGEYEHDDLERCIATAASIYKAEEDELGAAADGRKYTILGRDRFGQPFYTCGKILVDESDGQQYFFITAHEQE
jgi:hypothetical protein